MEPFQFAGDRRRALIYDLLESWHDILLRYEEKYPDDLPYLYGERTNIGFLAAAATKLGALVLEEFSCSKKLRSNRKLGRADLWIRPPGDNSLEYWFESKRICPNMATKPLKREIKNALKDAKSDIHNIREEKDVAIGIVFVSPYFPRRREFNRGKLRSELLDLSSLDAGFCGIHFCEQEIKRGSTHCWPCVAIVGRYL